MSKKTADNGYYVTDNKTFPVKWSAPEVLQYGKSSFKVILQHAAIQCRDLYIYLSIILIIIIISTILTILIPFPFHLERCMVVWGSVVGVV